MVLCVSRVTSFNRTIIGLTHLNLSLRAKRGNPVRQGTPLRERDRHLAVLLAMTNRVRTWVAPTLVKSKYPVHPVHPVYPGKISALLSRLAGLVTGLSHTDTGYDNALTARWMGEFHWAVNLRANGVQTVGLHPPLRLAPSLPGPMNTDQVSKIFPMSLKKVR